MATIISQNHGITKIISQGGNITNASASGTWHVSIGYWESTTNWISQLAHGSNYGLTIAYADAYKGKPYDVWVTYTK